MVVPNEMPAVLGSPFHTSSPAFILTCIHPHRFFFGADGIHHQDRSTGPGFWEGQMLLRLDQCMESGFGRPHEDVQQVAECAPTRRREARAGTGFGTGAGRVPGFGWALWKEHYCRQRRMLLGTAHMEDLSPQKVREVAEMEEQPAGKVSQSPGGGGTARSVDDAEHLQRARHMVLRGLAVQGSW